MSKQTCDKRRTYALKLAKMGFRIFPLRPGTKLPYGGESWSAIATTDAAQIHRWFDERTDMNYAVNCPEDFVIIDIDEGGRPGKEKHGQQAFSRAEDAACGFVENSAFDTTFRVRSPKGGFHLYFRSKRGYANSVGKVIKDCDVRGPTGYVVGPGCRTFDDPENNTVEGEYKVEIDGEPAELPAWLESLLDAGGPASRRAANAGTAAMPLDLPTSIDQACRVLCKLTPAIKGDGGDNHTIKTAMELKDYGITEGTCVDLMFSKVLFPPDVGHPEGCTWNETCEPPWSYEDLRTKVRNAYKYGDRQIGAKGDPLAAFGTEEVDSLPQSENKAKPSEAASESIVGAFVQPIGEDLDAKKIESSIMPISAFLKRKADAPPLIPGWVPSFGLTAMLAKRGTGKTVCLSDMANCIATDTPWNGVPVVKGWSVIYLCGEDDGGLQYHMTAWQRVHAFAPQDDRLLIAPIVPNLMDPHNVVMWAEKLKKRFGRRPVAVFVDTWQRATSSGEQNDDKKMQIAVHHAETLARSLSGCAIVAFHPPKNKEDTILGSSVIENATTSIIKMEKKESGIQLKVDRIKGRGEGNYFTLRFREVDLGTKDTAGDLMTGVVPEHIGGAGMAPMQRQIFDRQQTDARCQQYAVLVRELLESGELHLSPNRVVTLAHAGDLKLGGEAFPTRTRANSDMPKLFEKPFHFDDGVTLELVNVRGQLREFRLVRAGDTP